MADSKPPEAEPPTLVILCTWVNAAPRHIAKYTDGHSALYPSAAQLVLTTSLTDMIVRSESRQQSELAPAIQTIRSIVEENRHNARILLHVFSHGGAHKACQLAIRWRADMGGALPITALILDSTPGYGTYRRSLDAMVLSMSPSPVVQAIGIPIAHVCLASVWTVGAITGSQNVVQRLRAGLNDNSLFSLQTDRLYLYSKADKMVWWQDIEEHATTAEDLGCEVDKVRFEESPHAGHILEDANKYWDAIESTWKRAIKGVKAHDAENVVGVTR
jgi:hypothetical protein